MAKYGGMEIIRDTKRLYQFRRAWGYNPSYSYQYLFQTMSRIHVQITASLAPTTKHPTNSGNGGVVAVSNWGEWVNQLINGKRRAHVELTLYRVYVDVLHNMQGKVFQQIEEGEC